MGYRTASGDVVPRTSQDCLEVKQAFAALMRMLGWNVPRDYFADNFDEYRFWRFLSDDVERRALYNEFAPCGPECSGLQCDCAFGRFARASSREYTATLELPEGMVKDANVRYLARLFHEYLWHDAGDVRQDPETNIFEYQAGRAELTAWLDAWLECQPEPPATEWVDDFSDVDAELREHFARFNPPRIRLPQVGRGVLRREDGDDGVPMHATHRSEKKRRKYAVSTDR